MVLFCRALRLMRSMPRKRQRMLPCKDLVTVAIMWRSRVYSYVALSRQLSDCVQSEVDTIVLVSAADSNRMYISWLVHPVFIRYQTRPRSGASMSMSIYIYIYIYAGVYIYIYIYIFMCAYIQCKRFCVLAPISSGGFYFFMSPWRATVVPVGQEN